jgi:hypothetical protein
MKIREKRQTGGGFAGPRTEVRVVVLIDGDPLPVQAESVPDETPEHDWQTEERTN